MEKNMKTIGLIGGMSWESSLEDYKIINEEVHNRLGGVHSARCLMLSLDFAEIEEQQRAGCWDDATNTMIQAAQALERGGADFIVICTNTMHKMAGEVEASVHIPLLHIADAAAAEIVRRGMKTVGLLGTRFTMQEPFYRERLSQKFGLKVLTPPLQDQEIVHRVIYDELVVGTINPQSRVQYQRIIADLQANGAEGVILGCTEIGLLVHPQDCAIPLFDTTLLHALAAVDFCLA
jgi:aspartate racemase